MKVIVLACLVGVALCAPQQQFSQQPAQEILDTPDPYAFSLNVADDEFTNYQSRQESQDENGLVQGSYSFVAPNGIRYTTTYTADPINGYNANTVEEQTNIEVVIPVHPPFEQSRAL
ncbi:larval cuticle protein A2B-like [Homarus americanus]|uniref:Larval cuticle protein A3A-like 1 n=1 Tax=Homarus americanus TaxID=6706 RepID=A0A8J5MWL3_HOMAM|nr:larval cuticle protein A2B-like [Homarus americanus]KAG7166553.1 Larval cuticle protein A3A-like 1 [Homarus americanus]